jgi:hypothetical protein
MMKKTELFAKLEFVAFCIEQYKHKTHQNGLDVQTLFEERGVMCFLIEHYEILHTQSAESIYYEIEEYLNNHKI